VRHYQNHLIETFNMLLGQRKRIMERADAKTSNAINSTANLARSNSAQLAGHQTSPNFKIHLSNLKERETKMVDSSFFMT
jgi:hypothetical protein